MADVDDDELAAINARIEELERLLERATNILELFVVTGGSRSCYVKAREFVAKIKTEG